MEKIIEMVSVNNSPDESQATIFHHDECPFRLSDMPLPSCNTGFVYIR